MAISFGGFLERGLGICLKPSGNPVYLAGTVIRQLETRKVREFFRKERFSLTKRVKFYYTMFYTSIYNFAFVTFSKICLRRSFSGCISNSSIYSQRFHIFLQYCFPFISRKIMYVLILNKEFAYGAVYYYNV